MTNPKFAKIGERLAEWGKKYPKLPVYAYGVEKQKDEELEQLVNEAMSIISDHQTIVISHIVPNEPSLSGRTYSLDDLIKIVELSDNLIKRNKLFCVMKDFRDDLSGMQINMEKIVAIVKHCYMRDNLIHLEVKYLQTEFAQSMKLALQISEGFYGMSPQVRMNCENDPPSIEQLICYRVVPIGATDKIKE